jgi:EAL domain-containing protein (putative c-di-GMP-specific phosphodiesterase class I)/HAMP domain-containing protein
LAVTSALTTHFAGVSGDTMAAGDLPTLSAVIAQAVTRDEVWRISVRDATGRVLIEQGESPGADTVSTLAERVRGSRHTDHLRGQGGLALGAPILHGGQYLGVVVIMWDGDAYRFNAFPALAPFLVILACLALAAVPITARLVRRAAAPLNELARYAEQVTVSGGPSRPIDIRTGDEIEALANALNKMMARLDESMQRIQEIAFVDPATQLPNQDRLAREIDFAILQDGGEVGAVAVFELQRASRLRQSLDPSAAREFLRAIAEHLSKATQTVEKVVRNDSKQEWRAMAARLGADEFAVFAPALGSVAEAARFAQHLNAALNQPFDWRGHKLTLGACCGVALTPRDGPDAGAVIRRARLALGSSQSSPSRVRLFTPALDREATARLTLEREMRGALDRNEFRAYFQPKINLDTGRIEACEALARWVRPDRTIVGPARFIPVAEETGLIGHLSDAIMREACWKAAAWARAGFPVKVAVNVSALQFRSERFAENVLRILQHAGLPPDHLELEITESVALEDPDRALRLIQPLREAGVRLAIDDFGCGHSSLSALSKLPFDVIKIDQQFVRAIGRGDSHSAAIVEMILALARTLKMEVVAEGVERREDVEFMAVRGCRWVQGFLYGAAVSAPDFADLLRRQQGELAPSVDAA